MGMIRTGIRTGKSMIYGGVGKAMPGAGAGGLSAAKRAMKPLPRRRSASTIQNPLFNAARQNPRFAGANMIPAQQRLNQARAAGVTSAPITTPAVPSARAAGEAARREYYISRGKRPTRLAIGAGILGTSTAMRPNANESRTSYRGPMQTGRGSGRYA